MTTLIKKSDAATAVLSLRATFDSGVTKRREWRENQLGALRNMIVENESVLEAALFSDLGKSATEAQLTEIGIVIGEITNALKNLGEWLSRERVRVPLAMMPARASIVSEPLGVALVIAPWNYPLMLALAPVVGALAAGNCVLLKPSELSPATSAALAALIPVYLDTRAVHVIEGAAKETGWLLEQRFDHIFYTGNGRVGRIVAAAAAVNLTPVTLELGGKSPLYIDDSVDLEAAAQRIVWAKFLNAGQTCVAPDYILVSASIQAALEAHFVAAIASLFGAEPEKSPDYGRIVNGAHYDRLVEYLSDGRVVADGRCNPDTRFIPPTILADVERRAPIMAEEIFGPVLPMITVEGIDDAIAFILTLDKPLALYVFSDDAAVRKAFLERTSSGAIDFNTAVMHLSVPELPFGGVGASGMGSYLGKGSFDTFSHRKAIFSKPLRPETLRLIFPPYTEGKKKFIRGMLRRLSS
ncbi:aldehyde dehydrogenase family protein [Alpinimonas psychrophila]|uniref:Aldehyde dehydrogenase n=1 Tax=Alpinimonas psychrophila TaxID=748908 RepID=A0A7W3PMV5_9MICO|nr:aldehyde dehydrogenase family protein [Alpinimonas psychrophila]MBA8828244.1 aldehyde dehydrogenase (NAD+) [Alpinimonas psychrophila]